jgi:pimeloyl-ACP methyl ester carboxylesterase
MRAYACLAAALALACGCTTPVGVTSLGRNYGYEQVDRSALNSSTCSSHTADVLHRYNLAEFYDKSPTRCIIALHEQACRDARHDALFALAELSFLQGKRHWRSLVGERTLTSRNYFAASVVYAYLFLGTLGDNSAATPFDRRYRIASDLYNRGLGYSIALRDAPATNAEHTIALPVGSIRLRGGHSDFPKPLSEYKTVLSADRYKIHGLSVRNRIAGMGAPILIVEEGGAKSPVPSCASATVFIRVLGELADMREGILGEVDIYSPALNSAAAVGDRSVPLEIDMTTPIAYALNNPLYWQIDASLFRFGQSTFAPGIYPSAPHRPGKIPILWVHGTMSSPVWWAEMWNTLMGDAALRERYEHWFYLYDSAKPVILSAAHLRASIQDLVRQLDPEGKDAALRQLVVVGHSQGGLLTKCTAIETGDKLVRAATGKTFSELGLTPEGEHLARSYADLRPLPEVKRVIFISTPHRGSFLAGSLTRRAAQWFIKLPQDALEASSKLMNIAPRGGTGHALAATSLDSMSPDNPGLLALAEIPVSAPIVAHSIIAIKGEDGPPNGDDGVVQYTSAHIEGVASELVVRSGHSCQSHPATIEEVRRILLEHLANTSQPTGKDQ